MTVFTNVPGGVGCRRRSDQVAFPCRQQEDVAPTIASAFGATMPDAEGVEMWELLGKPQPNPLFPRQRSEPRVEADGGKLHVVWSERDEATGERVIKYQRLDPAGQTSFSSIPVTGGGAPAVVTISAATDAEGRRLTASQPYLFARQGQLRVVYSANRSVRDGRDTGENRADVYLVVSTDGGTTWNTPERVATSVVETSGSRFPTSYFAPASVAEAKTNPDSRRIWVQTARMPNQIVGFYRTDAGAWSQVTIANTNCPQSLDAVEVPTPECLGEASYSQSFDTTLHGVHKMRLVWQTISTDRTWEVYQSSKDNFDQTNWTAPSAVTTIGSAVTAYQPAVSLHGTTLNVLWADKQGTDDWRVRGSRVLGGGPLSGAKAFLPDVTPKSADVLYAVFSRVNPSTGDYDIYRNRSDDGGQQWPFETLLALSGTVPSLFPSVTWDGQGSHAWAVWRDGGSPDWVLKAQQIE